MATYYDSIRSGGSINGDMSLVGTGSNLFVGGETLLAGGNPNLTIADIGADFEVSGDTFMSFPITVMGYSNGGFVNPFTADNLGLPVRFSDLIITGGPLGYYHQSWTSSDTTPIGWESYIGSTSPTDPAFSFVGHKWNGTTGKATLGTGKFLSMTTDGFSGFAIFFADGTLNIANKLAFSSSGNHSADTDAWVGAPSHTLILNAESNVGIAFQAAGTQTASMTSTGVFTFAPIAQSSGNVNTFKITGAAHTGMTASQDIIDLVLDFSATLQHATGAVSLQKTIDVIGRTYSAVGASTFSVVETMAISNPIAGTNATFTEVNTLALGSSVNLGPSGASQQYSVLKIPDHTITPTGTTHNVFSVPAFKGVSIGRITITDVSSVTIDFAAALYLDVPPQASDGVTITNSYSIYSSSGPSRFNGNVIIGSMNAAGSSANGVLALSNNISAPSDSVDMVQLYAVDLSADNAMLGIYAETAAIAAVAVASTHKIPVKYNGTTYYLLATTVA